MVAPDLLDYVKLETEKEAALAKILRKAREERDLLRQQRGGKRGQDELVPNNVGFRAL